MVIEFFVPMKPPTCTAQEKRVVKSQGKYYFYDKPEVAAARQKLRDYIAKFRPEFSMVNKGAVRLVVKWLFPITGSHEDGEWKTTKPDTDNLNKMLKDILTELGFWKDDALVASEIIEKFWAKIPGIYIRIETLETKR